MASTTKEKSTQIYSQFTRDRRAAAQRRSGRVTPQAGACAIFLLRNRAADRGPIQMYSADTFSVAEIAGHALTDLSVVLGIPQAAYSSMRASHKDNW